LSLRSENLVSNVGFNEFNLYRRYTAELAHKVGLYNLKSSCDL
jgi:hypothetical protein